MGRERIIHNAERMCVPLDCRPDYGELTQAGSRHSV
jgi:hypothetical protein